MSQSWLLLCQVYVLLMSRPSWVLLSDFDKDDERGKSRVCECWGRGATGLPSWIAYGIAFGALHWGSLIVQLISLSQTMAESQMEVPSKGKWSSNFSCWAQLSSLKIPYNKVWPVIAQTDRHSETAQACRLKNNRIQSPAHQRAWGTLVPFHLLTRAHTTPLLWKITLKCSFTHSCSSYSPET